MKLKVLICSLCLCFSMCAMAQKHSRGNRGNSGNEAPRQFDMVVDTAIINSMELEPETISAVLQLQAQKQEELKAILIKMAQSRNNNNGQNFDPQAIAEMRQQMDDFKLEYRMAFRKIIGTANYITYLEKQLDNRQSMRPHNAPASRANRQRSFTNPGFGQNNGNWDNAQGETEDNNWNE